MVRMRCREEPAPVGKRMGECIVSLRGWHPALARAELSALFPNETVISLHRATACLTCSEGVGRIFDFRVLRRYSLMVESMKMGG